jgi:hypothetical protein
MKNETDKIILDMLNKLRSNLADKEKVKLTKVELLKSQINVLLELKNKFANRDMQYTQKPKD